MPRKKAAKNAFLDRKKDESTRMFFRREFDIDIKEVYERLKDVGKLSHDDLKNKHAIGRAINQAAHNAHMASVIYQKARKLREMYRIEFARKKRELTRIAIARIQIWFDTVGVAKKQITKDLIEEEIAAMDDTREEYTEIVKKQEELREIKNNLESLRDRWKDRQFALQTQAGLLKEQKEVILGK